jgi:hypothetical protein
MISAIAVPSFMTVFLPVAGRLHPADLRRSWNRILRAGKAEAASAGGSADMRLLLRRKSAALRKHHIAPPIAGRSPAAHCRRRCLR